MYNRDNSTHYFFFCKLCNDSHYSTSVAQYFGPLRLVLRGHCRETAKLRQGKTKREKCWRNSTYFRTNMSYRDLHKLKDQRKEK
jgi:hypothetical protein